MDNIERAAQFFRTIEEKDGFTLSQMLTDDFQYFGPTPDPFNKETWLAFQQAVQAAFPDWSYHLKKMEESGNSVEVTVEITGTHTQDLLLPWPGANPIPATGIRVQMPEEKATLIFQHDHVKELRVNSTPHGGLLGLLEQLGVQ